jgi:hypothetical protein
VVRFSEVERFELPNTDRQTHGVWSGRVVSVRRNGSIRTLREDPRVLSSAVLLTSCATESRPPVLESLPAAAVPSGSIAYP